MNYKAPGVQIEESFEAPPSVTQVATAIPVFIGYTQKAENPMGEDLTNEPKRITSLFEYVRFFGEPETENQISILINEQSVGPTSFHASIGNRSKFLMHYALQLFFANGGGACWIVSVGNYSTGIVSFEDMISGLRSTKNTDEITLYVYPDAQGIDNPHDFYSLFDKSLEMCEELGDRFTVMDVWQDATGTDLLAKIEIMRSNLSAENSARKYGAAYFPNVETILDYYYGGEGQGDENIIIEHDGGDGSLAGTLAELKPKNQAFYFQAQNAIRNLPLEMPPSPGIVGQYANVDASRGVWKAPANVNIAYVIRPMADITDQQQEGLNIDPDAGKSVNVIRSFVGRGNAIIWGARTLDGNDNEWRYIPVRRFFNMVEESVKKATIHFANEPNDANTWSRVKFMIENFLIQQWRAGALSGSKPKHAFYVAIGLGQTMTADDILKGRMIIAIGMAVLRPTEYIVMRIAQEMLSE